MIDYDRSIDFVLQRISFRFKGASYSGRGVMSWDPTRGFLVESPVDRHGPPLPPTIDFGRVGVRTPDDFCTIKMQLSQTHWAVARRVSIRDDELLMQGRLSVNLGNVEFVTLDSVKKSEHRIVDALFEFADIPRFEHGLETVTKVAGTSVSQSWWCGLLADLTPESRLLAIPEKGNRLAVHFYVGPDSKNWNLIRRWAEAARMALSIITSQDVQLLKSRVTRGNCDVEEVCVARPITKLGLLSFLDPAPIVGANDLILLTDFFVAHGLHADVCRKIFSQLAEAVRQKTVQSLELLCATILEATLRTVDHRPFVHGGKNLFKVKESLERFRKQYLSDKWVTACDRVLEAFQRLRHRNAHPDWLAGPGGALSEQERERALDDVVFLSRFYGYMIFAMAGFKDLQPRFPAPHKQWGALFTIGGLGDAAPTESTLTGEPPEPTTTPQPSEAPEEGTM